MFVNLTEKVVDIIESVMCTVDPSVLLSGVVGFVFGLLLCLTYL